MLYEKCHTSEHSQIDGMEWDGTEWDGMEREAARLANWGSSLSLYCNLFYS